MNICSLTNILSTCMCIPSVSVVFPTFPSPQLLNTRLKRTVCSSTVAYNQIEMMNQVFVIFVIVGVASSVNLNSIDLNRILGGSLVPLTDAVDSFISDLFGCLKLPEISIRYNEEMTLISPSISPGYSGIISGIINQLCLTNETQTLINIIDCIGRSQGTFRAELLNFISDSLKEFNQCLAANIQNLVRSVLGCNEFSKDFTSLIEYVIGILNGDSNLSFDFLNEIVNLVSNFNCLKYFKL